MTGSKIFVLDMAAKIDQCAEYLCKAKWGDIQFPPPFGRDLLPEVGLQGFFNCAHLHATLACTHKHTLYKQTQSHAHSHTCSNRAALDGPVVYSDISTQVKWAILKVIFFTVTKVYSHNLVFIVDKTVNKRVLNAL